MKRRSLLGVLWTTLATFGGLYLLTQAVLYHKVTTDPMFACTTFCALENSHALQMSLDLCLCQGEEGRKAQDGYQRVLNGELDHPTQCKLPRHK